MIGIQEFVTIRNKPTVRRDLFCGKCDHLLKINFLLRKKVEFVCEDCGTNNVFSRNMKQIRLVDLIHYHKRRPIRFWANKYGVPENSCYMAFRKHKIGFLQKKSGTPKMVTQREFLAGIIYTSKGREIVSTLIRQEKILTDKQIGDSV